MYTHWICGHAAHPPSNLLPLAVRSAVSREGAMWKRARNYGSLESAYSLLNREGATLLDCCHEGPVLSLLWIFHEMQEIQKLWKILWLVILGNGFECLKTLSRPTQNISTGIIFPFNHYFSTFAIDNGSLCIRLRLGSLNFSGSCSPCGRRMCASQSLSMENKTTHGRRGVKRGTPKVTETVTETLNRASLGGEWRWELCRVEICPEKEPTGSQSWREISLRSVWLQIRGFPFSFYSGFGGWHSRIGLITQEQSWSNLPFLLSYYLSFFPVHLR